MKKFLIKILAFSLTEENFDKAKDSLSSIGKIVDSGLDDDGQYYIECDLVTSAKNIQTASRNVENELNSLHITWDYINIFEQ